MATVTTYSDLEPKKIKSVTASNFSQCICHEVMETVSDFIFLGSKITADGYCRHEIKRRMFLGTKAMTKLDSI